MDELKLDPVRVGEENGIVSRRVAIFRRRIHDVHPLFRQQLVKVVSLFVALRVPGDVMEPWRIPVMAEIRALGPGRDKVKRCGEPPGGASQAIMSGLWSASRNPRKDITGR
jgi:hypothetical protein